MIKWSLREPVKLGFDRIYGAFIAFKRTLAWDLIFLKPLDNVIILLNLIKPHANLGCVILKPNDKMG